MSPHHLYHVWSIDFVQPKTHDGRSIRILPLIDEHSRPSLALKVAQRIKGVSVIEAQADALCLHGILEHRPSWQASDAPYQTFTQMNDSNRQRLLTGSRDRQLN